MGGPDNRTQRIAMGMFSDAAPLESTLQELLASAIAPQQLCLVGCGSRVESLLRSEQLTAPIQRHLDLHNLRTIATLANGALLVAAPDSFACLDFEREREAQGLLHGVEKMLIDGVLALLVKARTLTEFAAVTRLLLRYSSYHVRTREVVWPRA